MTSVPSSRTDPAQRLVSQGVAARIATLFTDLTGAEPPVRIRAWDDTVAGPAVAPEVVVRSPAALRRLAWRPNELGLAQAYVAGEIDVVGDVADGLRRAWHGSGSAGRKPGPGAMLRALAAARDLGAIGRRPPAPASQARLSGRLHTRIRDRRAIAHHYDLSNDFYALLLDESMAYSSAHWTSDAPDYTLADAQRDKLDLICRKLDLRPGQRLLDIGCGWGSLMLHAATHYGVQVVGVTLAAAQADHVNARIAERGLKGTAEVRLQHFRDIDLREPFDAVTTIEMGEHVGADAYPLFASTLHDVLVPGGRLVLQQMSRGANAPGGGAFIESFIAPDMHMRPLGATVGLLEDAGLEVTHVQSLRPDYVRTVRAWLDTLESRWDDAVALVGEETARVWRLYLAGGALAFEDGRMGVDQILAARPSIQPAAQRGGRR